MDASVPSSTWIQDWDSHFLSLTDADGERQACGP